MNSRTKWLRAAAVVLCMIGWMSAVVLPVQGFVNPAVMNQSTAEPPKIEVTYGLNENVKNESLAPVYIKVSSNSDFEGMLTIQFKNQEFGDSALTKIVDSLLPASFSNEENQLVNRSIFVSLKAGESIRRCFLLPVRYNDLSYEIFLKDLRGNQVAEVNKVIKASNGSGGFFVGVMSEDTRYQQNLNSFQWPYEIVSEQAYLKTILVEPEQLTVENLNCGIPDVLIFTDYGLDSLTVTQQEAIRCWQDRGGILIEGANSDTVNQLLLEALFNTNINKLTYRINGVMSTMDEAQYLLDNVPVRRQPNAVIYGVILMVYALMAGPGLYLLLKHLHKRYYLWSSMMLLSVGFVVLIGVYSSGTRVKAPFLTYYEVIEQRKSETVEKLNFGIQAPFNSSYSMYVDSSYDLINWASFNSGYSSQLSEDTNFGLIDISYPEQDTQRKKITISNFAAFEMNRFQLLKHRDTPSDSGISAELQVLDGKGYGSVVNKTNYELEDVAVLTPGNYLWIGRMGPGETKNIDGAETEDIYDISNEEYFSKKHEGSREENLMALSAAWKQTFSRYQNNVYTREDSLVMGRVVNKETSWQSNSGYEAYGYTFYVAPAKVSMLDQDLLYCSYAQRYRSDDTIPYIKGLEFDYNYLSEDEYTATYHFNDVLEEMKNQSLTIESLKFVFPEFSDKMIAPFNGIVEFYNVQTQSFEQLDNWRETLTQEQLAGFLGADNELTIRYRKADMKVSENQICILPDIHLTGRVKENAED